MVKKGFEYMNRKIAILFALVLFCVASAGCAQKTAQEETPIVTEMTFDIDGTVRRKHASSTPAPPPASCPSC